MKIDVTSIEFKTLLLSASAHFKLPNSFIEKDFWICAALKRLADSSIYLDHVVFKGGTSLSKAFKLINRLSEDIDLSLLPSIFAKTPSNSQSQRIAKKDLCRSLSGRVPKRRQRGSN